MITKFRKLTSQSSPNAVTASLLAALMSLGGIALARTAYAQNPAAATPGPDPLLQPYNITNKSDSLKASSDAVLIAFHDQVSASNRASLLSTLRLQVDPNQSNPYFVRVTITRKSLTAGIRSVKDLIAKLKKDKTIRIVEPDYLVEAAWVPNDTQYPLMWGLNQANDVDIDAPEAWDLTRGSGLVKVAVLDTGVDYNHPDLSTNILRDSYGQVVGYDFYNGDGDPMDDVGHGTHCAGTIGALGNNKRGIIGVAPSVKIIPVKFLGPNGGLTSNAIQAIDFARNAGANIMSNSWVSDSNSQLLKEAIDRARAAGILFVTAAGNGNSNNDSLPSYPASYNSELDNVISVGASTFSDARAWFSNYGAASVDIFAPGYGILSTVPGGDYDWYSGTSMAVPHVAGAAALIKARFTSSTYLNIKNRLLGGVDTPVGLAGYSQSGRLNAFKALENDTIAPGAPTNVIIPKRATTALLVQLKASGDDAAVGTAMRYEVRYSTTPITTANFASLPRVVTAPAPLISGATQSFLVTGLNPDTGYYVGVRAIDNAGNISALVTTSLQRTLPGALYLNDPVAAGDSLWTSTGTSAWSTTGEQYASSTSSWTDSPGASYENNTSKYLTVTTPIDLSGSLGGTSLTFKARTRLEYGYDSLIVQASGDGGATWDTLDSLTGATEWQTYRYSLSGYNGKSNVRIRFGLVTDDVFTDDGIWLDDIKISGPTSANYTIALQDGAESSVTSRYTGPAPWGVTTEHSKSGVVSYTDSPSASYTNYRNDALAQSSNLYLNNLVPELQFFANYNIEAGYDKVIVETSIDNGLNWLIRGSLTGWSGGAWQSLSYGLADLYGKNIRVRFRLQTDYDNSGDYDGIYLDDITVAGEKLVIAAVPTTPANFVATASASTTVNLSWNETPDADGYKLYRKLGNTTALVATLARGAKSYVDTDVSTEQVYTYFLRGFNAGGESIATTPIQVKTMNAPTNVAVVSGGAAGKVNVIWADASLQETNYQVEYKRTSATVWTEAPLSPAGATSLQLSLTSRTNYNFRVRAKNASGVSSDSAMVTFTAP